jgi:DNA-binding response OmpR family regulator
MSPTQTILAVDDNPAFNYAVCHTLRQAGHECLNAQTGSGANSVAENGRPDLVLLDIDLPDEMGKSAGGDGFLFAPVETAQLLMVIQGVLTRSREARTA